MAANESCDIEDRTEESVEVHGGQVSLVDEKDIQDVDEQGDEVPPSNLEVVTMASRDDWDKLLSTKNDNNSTTRADSWRTIDKQIRAFEELVDQMNVKCASLSAQYSALQHLTDCPFGTPRRVKGSTSSRLSQEDDSQLSSVRQLRDGLQKLRKRPGKTGKDLRAITDLDTLLKDLQFMRSLKRYFDEKVYCVLYRFFYDPFIVILTNPDSSKVILGLENTAEEEEESSVFLTELANRDTHSSRLRSLEKLHQCVDELYSINQRWDALCSMDDLSVTNFEMESSVRTGQFEDTLHFDSVFRMLPDLLCKCVKCIELAKEWLSQSKYLHGDSDPTVDWSALPFDIQKKMTDIEESILQKSVSIRHLEHALNIHSKDLEFLESKEERVKGLMTNCEKISAHRTSVGERYKGMIRRRQETVQKLENTIQGTQRYQDLSSELRQLELDICEQYTELKLTEYGLDIAQSDCKMEAEAAPNFIIFSQTEREKIDVINNDLKLFRQGKDQLSQQSELVKSNHAKMMEILTLKMGPNMSGVRPIQASSKPGSMVVARQLQGDKLVGRPTTNATYSIDKVSEDRYSDKDDTSDATVSEDEHNMPVSKAVNLSSRRALPGLKNPADPHRKAVLVSHNRQL